MYKIRFLSQTDVIKALQMPDAIVGMKSAFAQLSTRKADMPLRGRTNAADNGVVLTMPAYLQESGDLGVKIVSVFPGNTAHNLPIIHALVLAIDATTGQPLAIIEGGALTAIRTGAGSGAATDILARQDSSVVAVIGAGVQAKTQLEAVCAVREIEHVYLYSRSEPRAVRFIDEVARIASIPDTITLVDSPEDTIREADIICTATTSFTPVFDGTQIKPGAHINAVGSYTPQMQEVDATTLQRAYITVDSREAVLAEAGEIIIAMQNGQISADAIDAEIGEVINGTKPGRTSDEQITYFKSVGVAVQDAISAKIALRYAEQNDIGTLVDF